MFTSPKNKDFTEPGCKSREEDAAAKDLAEIFLSDLSKDVDHQRACSILQRFPQLSYHRFGTEDMTPLHCMLSCDHSPSLEQIQAVYDMNPGAVMERQGSFKNAPMHLVCKLGIHDPAIAQFIFSQHPSALTTKNSYGRTPMCCLIQDLKHRPDKLPILRMLLDVCPGCLEEKFPGMDPFIVAVRGSWGLDALNIVAEYHPEHIKELDLKAVGRFNTQEVEILCKIVPKLKHLTCPFICMESNDMTRLLDCLRDSQSLQSLSLDWLLEPDSSSCYYGQACKSLKLLLLHSKNLKSLKLDFVSRRLLANDAIEDSNHSRKLFLCNLLQGLTGNAVLEELVLNGFVFPPFERESLVKSAIETTTTSTSQSGLRKLALQGCCGSDNLIPYLVDMLSLLPSVTDLELNWLHNERKACPNTTTEALVQLLSQHKLVRLKVENNKVDLGKIFGCLRSDTSLKHLNLGNWRPYSFVSQDELLCLLEESNTTLEVADVFPPRHLDPSSKKLPHDWRDKKMSIYQYLNLNKYGRSLVRNPDTSHVDFVEAIARVVNEDKHVLNERNKSLLGYELLREAPGIWAR